VVRLLPATEFDFNPPTGSCRELYDSGSLDAAVASLPEPASSTHAQAIAEAILRAAHNGERDPIALQRLALLELQIRPRQ
jgi:hypothetical protein